MSDDRSERLRKRRRQSTGKRDRANGDQTAEGRPEDSGASRNDDESEGDTSRYEEPIKEEQIGTYMYLPESQTKELRRVYNILKAEYEFEFDEEFEKNRHFYPLVIQYGLETLDGADAFEIREYLDGLK